MKVFPTYFLKNISKTPHNVPSAFLTTTGNVDFLKSFYYILNCLFGLWQQVKLQLVLFSIAVLLNRIGLEGSFLNAENAVKVMIVLHKEIIPLFQISQDYLDLMSFLQLKLALQDKYIYQVPSSSKVLRVGALPIPWYF